jgi:methyl-accepting chemotaxis protein
MSLLAVAISAAVGLWAAGRLTTLTADVIQTKDVVADVLPPPLYLIEMRLLASEMLEGSISLEQAQGEFKRLASEHDARERYWTEHPIEGLDPALLRKQFDSAHRFMDTVAGLLARAGSQHPTVDMGGELGALHRTYLEHRTAVDHTVVVASRLADSSISDLNTVIGTSRNLLWATLAVTVLWTAAAFFLVVRSIVHPLNGAIHAVQRAAAGDLSHDVHVEGQDELSGLQRALSEMQKSLAAIVHAVRENAIGVASASTRISEGNHDLCQRTEAQASALQQTAATMEELGATVRSNADHARRASALALEASHVVEEGGEVMGRVVQTMGGISGSSKRIREIVGVIDGIAFQTNILALNAAVEAARAGELGRGFGVVAAEVRTLSQRTAQSAREINQLIADSTRRVEDGCKLVDQAGETMQRIVDAIKRVNGTVLHISSATSEQSVGVSQVGEVVVQLDRNTQRNAALVVQSAAAAESLREQSCQLVEVVQRFRIEA